MPQSNDAAHEKMSRTTSLDALKGVGIIAVIFLHLPSSSGTMASQSWQILLFSCRFAIPLFFMISGYFFMRGWESQSDDNLIIRRYAARLLKIFFFWGFFFAVVPPYVGGAAWNNGNTLLDNLSNILLNPHGFLITGYVYHLWFLSSLLQGILLVWFFLRFRHFHVVLLMGCLFYAVALLGAAYSETPLGFKTHFDMKTGPLVSTISVALGAWIARRRNFSTSRGIVISLSGLALCFCEQFFLRLQYQDNRVENGFLIGTIPYALGLLWVALSRPNLGRFMAALGTSSLGIYILHVYVIEILNRFQQKFNLLWSPWIFASVCLAFSGSEFFSVKTLKWIGAG